MKLLFNLIFLVLVANVWAQKATLSGIITDEATGETLVNANVILRTGNFKGTVSDINGFFSLPGIDPRQTNIEIMFMGYETAFLTIDFSKEPKVFVEVKLKPSDIVLEQINIVETGTDRIGDREVEISQHTLTPKAIKSIPSARNDVFKAIKYLPGVESTEPFSPLVSVRGSDPGENLIMLDGVTIYNPYHSMSSSGIFNMQTVKHVDLLIGGFGAEYGGRNASVINIATKDGNNNGIHGEVHPSTAESKIFLEFPVGIKSTMMVAGRFNYDIAGNFMLYSNNYFTDLNLSFTHRFNAKNSVSLKYFASSDKTNMDFNNFYKYFGNSIGNSFDDEVNMGEVFNNMSIKYVNNWRNHIGTAILKSILGPRLFLRTQVYGSLHKAENYSELAMRFEDVIFDTSTRFKSKVHDWSGKVSLNYKPFIWNDIKVGAEYNKYLFFNGSEVNNFDNGSAQRTPYLLSFFAENKISIGNFTLRPGLRITNFNHGDIRYEPRINAVLKINGGYKLEAAWGRYNQYIISMNTQELELNQVLDYYYPLYNGQPSQSEHFIVGLEKTINSGNTLSLDVYYKDISRTYTFDLMQDQYEAFALSDKIIAGSGKSYGMEMMWKGSIGKWSGWSSYTLSRTTRSFPNIMNGKNFDYDYDRRHSIKAVVNYQATQRISYSAAFKALSGVPRSIENTLQLFYMYDPLTGSMIYSPQYVVDKKNASRMPWLFYLDLGLQKKLVSGFGKNIADFFGAQESYLVVNVYNALFFRRNVLYYIPTGEGLMIPMGDNYLPTVSAGYTLKF